MNSSFLVRQFGKPSGVIGNIVGWAMRIKNKERSTWTIEKLNLNPSDVILEIGYGSGDTIYNIAKKLGSGKIIGIDHSAVMFRMAARKNHEFIQQRKVEINMGTIENVPCRVYSFDIIFGSNVHMFWNDPKRELRNLFLLLKPGGKIVITYQPRNARSDEEIKKIAADMEILFKESGLKRIERDFKKMKPVACIAITGYR